MSISEQIAREIVKYCFKNDVLTQHGMKGLREMIGNALTGADSLHELALVRVSALMSAKADTAEGVELNDWVSAIEAYEKCLIPNPGFDISDLVEGGDGGRPNIRREQHFPDY